MASKAGGFQWRTFCLFVACLCSSGVTNEQLPEPPASAGEELDSSVMYSNGPINCSRPCVPKCCNLHQGFTFENRSACVDTDDEFVPEFEDRPNYTEEAKRLPVKTRYEYFIGDPCSDGKYHLDQNAYPDDEFSVYSNGSLLYLDRLYSKEDFCLETLNGSVNAFLCFGAFKPEQELSFTFILYAIGLLISIPFLLITAVVHLCISMLRDLRGKSLACHVLCLATGYLSLAIVQLSSDQLTEEVCISAGFLIQFFFVASFFWLNVLCFDTWRCINNDFRCAYMSPNLRSEKVTFCWYSAYGWYGPMILSIVTLVMDFEPTIPESYLKPNMGLRSCWFYSDDAALPYFYGPVALIILVNILFFFLSARKIYREQKRRAELKARNRDSVDDAKERHLSLIVYTKTLRECIYLFCIMGINWSAEVISWAVGGSEIIWLVTDVFNALQGIVIFYLFVIKPERVRKEIKNELRKTWKKIIKCDCHYEEENKRVSRHWHAPFQYQTEESCIDNENEKILGESKPAAV